VAVTDQSQVEPTEYDRDMAGSHLWLWGAWQDLAGSIKLRDTVAGAIAAARAEERERCVKKCDEAARAHRDSMAADGRNAYDIGGRQTAESLAAAMRCGGK
jgi:hypothetical protein